MNHSARVWVIRKFDESILGLLLEKVLTDAIGGAVEAAVAEWVSHSLASRTRGLGATTVDVNALV